MSRNTNNSYKQGQENLSVSRSSNQTQAVTQVFLGNVNPNNNAVPQPYFIADLGIFGKQKLPVPPWGVPNEKVYLKKHAIAQRYLDNL